MLRRPRLIDAALAGLLFACACAPAASAPSVASEASATRDQESLDRLRKLAAERSGSRKAGSYRIGPGDLISVSVFKLPDMNRKVRVAEAGQVQLPLIGAVRAAGRTEAELAADIADTLSLRFLKNPQVDVFVEEYQSQQAAVTGAVAKPGLYPLTKDRYTILDVISQAGGLTKDAGSFIELIPADAPGASAAFEKAQSGALEEIETVEGITVDLNELMRGSNRALLGLPVIPGDVVFVPEAGSFAIEGWVEKPGTYPLTRGMTVLSAISTGGGALFPGRISQVELLRAGASDGNRSIEIVDVAAVRQGREHDTVLRAGDVVRVPANAVLVPPWALYSLVRELIRFGASVAIF